MANLKYNLKKKIFEIDEQKNKPTKVQSVLDSTFLSLILERKKTNETCNDLYFLHIF